MGIANTSFIGIKVIDLSDSTQVNSGGATNTQVLQPPSGQVYQIAGIEAKIPAIGGGSGNHSLEMNRSTTIQYPIMSITGDSSVLAINHTYLSATTEVPSATSQEGALNNVWLSNSEYINFLYTNNSDTNQTGNRQLLVCVKVFKEGY